ncbi:MAG: class I SAM-dependent methyltransferase [Firmicutes bacterium]|nr:class I SAM-dependent methyltransferase [Bacillota bacterium]
MKEIEQNKKAWNLISEDHYHHFKKVLEEKSYELNPIILEELGNIKGKSLIHLQCNTGADTLSLAREGALVTGVDFVKGNVYYAKLLANDLGIPSASFIESDILTLSEIHHQTYDIVFTSEGVLGWIPDLDVWARTIRALLKDTGFFYINEIHPFYLIWDEEAFSNNEIKFKYPYFGRYKNIDTTIGGYAVPSKQTKAYDWMYSVSDVINALIKAGLQISYFHEFDTLCFDAGNMEQVGKIGYRHPQWKDKLPMQFSIKATVAR